MSLLRTRFKGVVWAWRLVGFRARFLEPPATSRNREPPHPIRRRKRGEDRNNPFPWPNIVA